MPARIDKVERTALATQAVKGCLFFIALFVLGLGLMAAGLIQDLMVDGFGVQLSTAKPPAEDPRNGARILEVSGLVLAFGAIYGAAAWRFFKQRKAMKAQEEHRN